MSLTPIFSLAWLFHHIRIFTHQTHAAAEKEKFRKILTTRIEQLEQREGPAIDYMTDLTAYIATLETKNGELFVELRSGMCGGVVCVGGGQMMQPDDKKYVHNYRPIFHHLKKVFFFWSNISISAFRFCVNYCQQYLCFHL